MADLTQSSAVTATTTPEYYNQYIQNLALQGTQHGIGGPQAPTFVGAQDQQNQAWNLAGSNVGNYQPGLTQAGNLVTKGANVDITGAANPYLQAGTSSAADLVGGYMNPYTQNVVDQIRMANQQNIAQNLSPGITAGAVGSGQFGSQRGANALALGISNADIGALAQQAAALQSGYSDALKAAQAQRVNQVNSGQIAGNVATQQAKAFSDLSTNQANLAKQQQDQGIADVNQLATMGAQKQQILANQQLYPLDVLNKQASVLSGAQLPTTQTATMQGSPLSLIAGLSSTAAGMLQPGASTITKDPVTGAVTSVPGPSLWDTLKKSFSSTPQPSAVPQQGVPNNLSPSGYSDMNGKPVNADGSAYTGSSGSKGYHFETEIDPETGEPINKLVPNE